MGVRSGPLWPLTPNDLAAAALPLGLELTPGQIAGFAAFEEALYRANEVSNLTRVPQEEAWLRHTLDSLLISPLLPEGTEVLDIGTGAGFPAWPLAFARPDLRVTALDSAGKSIRFLRSQPLPNLEVVQGRAEEWEEREAFDVVTGRAVAPLAIQVELSARLARIGGAVIPMRTPGDDVEDIELGPLGLELERVETATLPVVGAERVFPVYRKVRRTEEFFPRRWAEMRAMPMVRGGV